MKLVDGLQIKLPARAENLYVIRRDVAAHAEKLGMIAVNVADLKIVVSEACANVVRHAYEDRGGNGSLEVELSAEEQELSLVVRDFGVGICPKPDSDTPSLRMGLPVIGALSTSFLLSSVRDRGTEIRVRLPLGSTL
jgi:anti-sigma regulatory factor (Ser/Thr protein kinase)